MSQFVDTNTREFDAGGALALFARVILSGSPAQLSVAGAQDVELGTIETQAFVAGEMHGVRLRSAAGTAKMIAAVAIAVNDRLWAAAAGKVTNVPGAVFVGLSLSAASGNNSIIEVLRAESLGNISGTTLAAIGTQNATLTAAQLLGGVIEHTVITGAGTDTTDTAANLDAALTDPQNGDTFECELVNTAASALAITIAAGAGVTLKGSVATVAQNKSALLTFRRTGAGAWTCYVLVSA